MLREKRFFAGSITTVPILCSGKHLTVTVDFGAAAGGGGGGSLHVGLAGGGGKLGTIMISIFQQN